MKRDEGRLGFGKRSARRAPCAAQSASRAIWLRAVFALVLAALCVAPVSAQTQTYTTSSGHSLDLPPVASLDCSQLDAVLARIDGVNYRPIGPKRPTDPADLALWEYERKVAMKLAEKRCQRSGDAPKMGRMNLFSNN